MQPGHAAEVSLLLLDPGQDTAQLAAALREKRGWQVWLGQGALLPRLRPQTAGPRCGPALLTQVRSARRPL